MNELLEQFLRSDPKANDPRDSYQKDKCRVLHSFAFRRLGGKTQVYGNYNSDFHRTRLTHSLEVASVGRHIAHALKTKQIENSNESDSFLFHDPKEPYYLSDDLVETLGLLHDIGHPPFGHGGEIALNFILNRYSAVQVGFEGNAQSLKIAKNMNLSRRTLLGLLKYPIAYDKAVSPATSRHIENISLLPDQAIPIRKYMPPKCYYHDEQPLIDWILEPFNKSDISLFLSYDPPNDESDGKPRYKSFDCSIMDLADDITYCIHDLEDAIFLKLIQEKDLADFNLDQHFKEIDWNSPFLQACDSFTQALFSKENKKILSHLINEFITHAYIKVTHPDFLHPLFKYNVALPKPMADIIETMKTAIQKSVVYSQENQSIVYGGQMLVIRIFEALQANPAILLNEKDRKLYFDSNDPVQHLRIIADYIAGMTDEYAQHLYQRLYGLNLRSIFERL